MKLCPLEIQCCGMSLWVMVEESDKLGEQFDVKRVREALLTAIEDRLIVRDGIVKGAPNAAR